MTPWAGVNAPVTMEKPTFHLLPPLILHPFSDATGPNKLVESSRASLALQGLLPSGAATPERLERAMLDGRLSELRMLFYVGKDVLRWIDQCLEFVSRNRGMFDENVVFQSFAALLVQDPPARVQDKLRKWGVADFKAIFSRGIGLNCIFSRVPEQSEISDDFVRNYHRYADQVFNAKQSQAGFRALHARNYQFEIYSSAEYTRMLERSFEEQ